MAPCHKPSAFSEVLLCELLIFLGPLLACLLVLVGLLVGLLVGPLVGLLVCLLACLLHCLLHPCPSFPHRFLQNLLELRNIVGSKDLLELCLEHLFLLSSQLLHAHRPDTDDVHHWA